LFCLDWNLMV